MFKDLDPVLHSQLRLAIVSLMSCLASDLGKLRFQGGGAILFFTNPCMHFGYQDR